MLPYKRYKGEITVFLSLVSLVVIAFLYVVITSARSQTSRMEAESIVEISLESAFAEYNKALFDKYGLLYVDTSYLGTMDGKDESFLCKFVQYLDANSALISNISYLSSDVSTIHHACDDNYSSVLCQIKSYMNSKGDYGEYLDDYIFMHKDLYEEIIEELLIEKRLEYEEEFEESNENSKSSDELNGYELSVIEIDEDIVFREYLKNISQEEKIYELAKLIEKDMREENYGTFDFDNLIDMAQVTVYMEDSNGKVYECIRQYNLTE